MVIAALKTHGVIINMNKLTALLTVKGKAADWAKKNCIGKAKNNTSYFNSLVLIRRL